MKIIEIKVSLPEPEVKEIKLDGELLTILKPPR